MIGTSLNKYNIRTSTIYIQVHKRTLNIREKYEEPHKQGKMAPKGGCNSYIVSD